MLRRMLEALEREEVKGRTVREAWRARKCEVEIPASAKLRLKSMGCDCCRSRLETAMLPVAGQHAEAKGGTAEAGCEREDSTERNAGGNTGAQFVHV